MANIYIYFIFFSPRCSRKPDGVGGSVRAQARVPAARRALRGGAVRRGHRGRSRYIRVSGWLYVLRYMTDT